MKWEEDLKELNRMFHREKKKIRKNTSGIEKCGRKSENGEAYS